MAAVTPTELSVENFPVDVKSGTYKRRARVYIRAAAGSTSSTINLTTYVPGVADVEGIVFDTDGDALEATASTWSTYTITLSSGATGAYEGCFSVNFT